MKMYHTCVFAGLAIYGHLDHQTDITIEFMLKNGSQRCITLVCLPDLPYMVTLITKLTSPLNSCQKMVPKDVSHLCLPDLPHKVTLIMKLTSPLNSCQKMVPKDDEDSMGTPQDFEGIIMTFEQVMQSP